jgi:hypothetical protein
MMLSRGNDFRWLHDAKLPDTRTHRSKAYARPVPGALRTKRLPARARGNRWRYLRQRWYAPRAPRCCAVLPIVRGRDTAVATCWLRKGSTDVVIGREILPRYRRFLRGQSRQGFAEGMFVSRRGRNRRCAKASGSRLNRGVFVRKGTGDTSTHDRMGFGTEAVLQLECIAIFRTASDLD